MSVQISVGGSSEPTRSAGGVTIPIGNVLPLPQFGVTREERVVRALAAAATLQDPAKALTLAKQAVEDPAAVAANAIDKVALDPVLATVSAALGQSDLPQPTPEQRAAAGAVGADAALVAVAQAALATDAKGASTSEALEWVAVIEPVLLDRAAHAGLRQRNLNFVPPTTNLVASSRLDAIEQRLKALEDSQKPAPAPAHKAR